ncbi:hypothetical protein [Paenibacillus jilunlii]|uniref:DUF4375 domain-containing protein n=1 Tax=Paenibacillus jilunlii TaxID=682956 RepID=A0A1G9YDZ8_9BACL|nr:hypothetical protein [Paenibacillus jilunlii]KWX78767.1 hypothetical protein AML91_04405 [Paenibacillus jilunlii]SDN07369.1 hypothetical protein SAMN05216191_12617 [Paenibacillus jilunlii]
MLVAMERKDFDTYCDERLAWACMEPIFMPIRGKSPALKAAAIKELGKGQRALCMFRIMYDHSCHSPAELYAWSSYLLDQPGYWSGVLEGVRFFADDALRELLEETQERLEARNRRLGLEWGDAGLRDLETDQDLLQIITVLYDRFQRIIPKSHALIAEYIRAHPDEFVEFT